MTLDDLRKLLPAFGEPVKGVRTRTSDGRGATLWLHPPKKVGSVGEIRLLWHDTGAEMVLYKSLQKILSKAHPEAEEILSDLQLGAPKKAQPQLNQGWDDDPLS